MISILVGLFGLIYVGGTLLILSLIGIRQRVRFINGYDSELETDWIGWQREMRRTKSSSLNQKRANKH